MIRRTFLKLLALAPISVRVLRQGWARTPIYFPFGAYYWAEPVGWKLAGVVYDHPVADAEQGNWHRGSDFPFPVGTVITAALSGRVTYAGWSDLGYGRLVAIEGSRYKCRYAHLSLIWAKVGLWVPAGSDLGLSGDTGNTTGPHLHFEVYDKQMGAYIDPFRAPLPGPAVSSLTREPGAPLPPPPLHPLDSEHVG